MIFEFEDIGFKFGLYASAITEKEAGRPISEVVGEMGKGHILPILQYFYGAAAAYNESKGKPKITMSDVSDAIEKIGLVKIMNVLQETLQMPKNSEAPKETGQP